MWQVELILPRRDAEAMAELLTGAALALSLGDLDRDGPLTLRLLAGDNRHLAEIEAKVAVAAGSLGLPPPATVARPLPETDWVRAYEAGRPPLRAGRFFVHGSHVRDLPASGAWPLHIDAGRAFGSGEHESTLGCLLALDRILRRRRGGRVLDVGCGSGILGIAAAKAGAERVVATDIDPVAARVAAENARINRVAARVATTAGRGLDPARVRRGGPYDLILANILARPLERLAPPIAGALSPNGQVVLSGLLDRQEAGVLAAYRCARLTLRRRVRRGAWVTLVLAGTPRNAHVLPGTLTRGR